MAAIGLIAGLGNPGAAYAGTRHNAGAMFVERLAERCGVKLATVRRFNARAGRTSLDGRGVRLLVPTTYMNASGDSVASFLRYYGLSVDSLLIAHDEIDLPPGVARLKRGGGHGGHNGLRDLLRALGGARDFARLRIGVGHPGEAAQVVPWVLARPSPQDREAIDAAIDEAVRVVPELVAGSWQRAVTALHSTLTVQPPPQPPEE